MTLPRKFRIRATATIGCLLLMGCGSLGPRAVAVAPDTGPQPISAAYRLALENQSLIMPVQPNIGALRPGDTVTIVTTSKTPILSVTVDGVELSLKSTTGFVETAIPANLGRGLHRVVVVEGSPIGQLSIEGSFNVTDTLVGAVQADPAPKALSGRTVPFSDLGFDPTTGFPQGDFSPVFDVIDGDVGVGLVNPVTGAARFVRSDTSDAPGPKSVATRVRALGYSSPDVFGFLADDTAVTVTQDGSVRAAARATADHGVELLGRSLGGHIAYDPANGSETVRSRFDERWYRSNGASGLELDQTCAQFTLTRDHPGVVDAQWANGQGTSVLVQAGQRLSILDSACNIRGGRTIALIQATDRVTVLEAAAGKVRVLGSVQAPGRYRAVHYISFAGQRALAAIPLDDGVHITPLDS